MVDVGRLRILLALTVSTPIKPGAVHRLLDNPLFEKRLVEAIIVSEVMEDAYARGREVALGDRPAQALGLGGLIAQAYRRSFEVVDVRPLTGLSAAAVSMAAIAGYLDGIGKGLREGLRQGVLTLLYSGGGRDSIEFIEGLEAVGDSDALLHLEREGLSKRVVSLEDIPLGDVFEKLSSFDLGFLVNLRGYQSIMDLARRAERAKSLAAAILASYLTLLEREGVRLEKPLTVRRLAQLDRELRERGGRDRLLGAVFAATSIVLDSRPDIPVA